VRTQGSNQGSLEHLRPAGKPVAGVTGVISPARPPAAAASGCLLPLLGNEVGFRQQLRKLTAELEHGVQGGG